MLNNKLKRKLVGTIVSDKMNKTRIVEVHRFKKHTRYHKYFRVTRRYKVHDSNNQYKIGEVVLIQESRPLSKEKRWQIIELAKNKK